MSIISAHRVCFRVEISCCIFKRGPLKVVENDAKFRTFRPPVKIRGGVREISGSRFVTLPTTEPGMQISLVSSAPILRKVHCLKKEEKSTAVKLKAVPTESADGCDI